MKVENIHDEDELYRRIWRDHFKPDGSVSSAAFQNTTNTFDMSVDLGRLTTPEKTAMGRFDLGVAKFSAKLARQFEQDVFHDPVPENYAHSTVRGQKSRSVRRHFAKGCEVIVYPKEGASNTVGAA